MRPPTCSPGAPLQSPLLVCGLSSSPAAFTSAEMTAGRRVRALRPSLHFTLTDRAVGNRSAHQFTLRYHLTPCSTSRPSSSAQRRPSRDSRPKARAVSPFSTRWTPNFYHPTGLHLQLLRFGSNETSHMLAYQRGTLEKRPLISVPQDSIPFSIVHGFSY